MKALVCIHGFGGLKTKDFDYLRSQFESSMIHYFDFDLYDVNQNPDWKSWVKTAYQKVKQVCDQGYEVTLLGFSMGGVIVGYLASRLPIKRVILVAPAYVYLGVDSGGRYVKRLLQLQMRGKKELNAFVTARWLNVKYILSFMELVRVLKHSIKDIQVPVLILQASKDDIVPLRSSYYVMNCIKHNQKEFYILPGGTHEVLNDEHLKHLAYLKILAFCNQD